MEDIAIVGMSCLFPGAGDPRAFWQNVVDGVDAIGEAPAEWWPKLYGESADGHPNDRVYTSKGGFLGDLSRFKPARYGVMPSSVDGAEPDHFLALRCAVEALADAGVPELPLHRKKTGVILARGLYVNRGTLSWVAHGWAVDQVMAVVERLHPELDGATLGAIKKDVKSALPPFNAEVVPGLVNSVMCGRIANRLDLQGPAYTVDAACASTLIAVEQGMRELASGRCDAVLVGGVQVSTPGPIHLLFSNLEAASHSGRIAPFGADADGTLLGEGCGILVLKRRVDAERDGHRIYALLRGVGTSSDGRALGLLAPRFEGQVLALTRAYQDSGIDPATIGLIEAHGTATARGDATELQSLVAQFGRRKGERATIALGAVKSMIGHLLPAAGSASLIKTALALYHRVLPPTLHAQKPNPALKIDETPFYLSTATRPWIHADREHPRRAGVNAFGFGGINAHAILEEHVPADERVLPRLERRWPVELIVVSAADRAALVTRASALAEWLDANPTLDLVDVAAASNREGGATRLALVAKDPADLAKKLRQAVKLLGQADREKIQDRTGVFWYQNPLARDGRVAWVFPGEGAQYVNMLADLARHFPEVRREFDRTDAGFASRPGGKPVSPLVFPLPGEEQQAEDALLGLEGAVGTVIAAERALMALLERLRVPVHAIVGHSSGEFMALEAAGAYALGDEDARIRAIAYGADVATRIAGAGLAKTAVLTSVGGADPVAVHEVLERSGGRLVVAMDNCPSQLVVSGDEEATQQALEGLRGKGGLCERLPWGRAYHTDGFRPACPILAEYYATMGVARPRDRAVVVRHGRQVSAGDRGSPRARGPAVVLEGALPRDDRGDARRWRARVRRGGSTRQPDELRRRHPRDTPPRRGRPRRAPQERHRAALSRGGDAGCPRRRRSPRRPHRESWARGARAARHGAPPSRRPTAQVRAPRAQAQRRGRGARPGTDESRRGERGGRRAPAGHGRSAARLDARIGERRRSLER
jgi:acyl transferase domain-containing protein